MAFSRNRRLAALAACLALQWPAHAQQGEPPEAPPVPQAAEEGQANDVELEIPDLDEVLETTRSSVRSTAEWLARAVDGIFGDRSFDQFGKVSNGRVDLSVHKRQREKRQFDLRFNANFRLPNLEERVHIFVGNDDQRDLVTDNPQAFSQQQRLLESRPTVRSFFAGLKLPFFDSFEFRLGMHGVRKPFAQMSYDRSWKVTEDDAFEFRETLFWTIDDHLGSTTVGSYAHAFTPTLYGRWLNSATITRVANRFAWNSSLGAYQTFGAQRVLSLEALLSGVQGSGVGVSEYGLQVRWEQPLYRNWLLGEVAVGHFWPRADAFSERIGVWGLGATLKMKF
ncbi:MAG: hypothetical protein ABL900_14215 [Burkholderiaceae bacterium]